MAEEDKEPKQPEEQQPTEGPTEEAKDEAPNPEKGDSKGSKSSSAEKDNCTYCTFTRETLPSQVPPLRETAADIMSIITPPAAPFLGSYGNAAGNKVESTLSPIGRPVGKGLETVTKPVGGVVDAVVGGLIRSGAAYGEVAGVGAGNMDKKKAEEEAERHAEVGGKEQTGENPLGI